MATKQTKQTKQAGSNNNLRWWLEWEDTPAAATKSFSNGTFSGTDINPTYRLKALTERFGPCGFGWYYTIDRQWLETYGNVVKAFCNVSLYVKAEGEWSMPIQGTGGNFFTMPSKAGVRVSDECYKMALTDAISVACHRLGIGANIYWAEGKSKYTLKPEEVKTIAEEPADPLDDKLEEALAALEAAKLDGKKIGDVWEKYAQLQPGKDETSTAKLRFKEAVMAKCQEVRTKGGAV